MAAIRSAIQVSSPKRMAYDQPGKAHVQIIGQVEDVPMKAEIRNAGERIVKKIKQQQSK